MTLSDLQTALYRRLNWADSPDTATVNRLLGFLNQRHRRLLSSPALRQLREGFGTLTSVAGQAVYAVPFGITRLNAVRDLTNDRALSPLAQATWRSINPDPESLSGTPDAYVPIGERAIIRQPGGAGLWAVSSSAADTTQVVHLTAALTATSPRGFQQTSTNTLNGTTRVRLGTGTDTFDDVVAITLSAATAGTVSVFDAAVSGNTVAVIFAGRRTSRVYALALHPTPASALDYQLDYEHAIVDLANAWDEPLLPVDFRDLLVLGALMDEYQVRDDDRYAMAAREYDQRHRELKAFLANHHAALAPLAPREIAPVGPWYPRQGW